MNNDLYYDFPKNGCRHLIYNKSKCEWESHGKKKLNFIMECEDCHELAESNVHLIGEENATKKRN